MKFVKRTYTDRGVSVSEISDPAIRIVTDIAGATAPGAKSNAWKSLPSNIFLFILRHLSKMLLLLLLSHVSSTVELFGGQGLHAGRFNILRQIEVPAFRSPCKVNSLPFYASHQQGAEYVSALTSEPTSVPHQMQLARRMRNQPELVSLDPRVVLRDYAQHKTGRCWSMKGSEGHLGVALLQAVHVTNITIFHDLSIQDALNCAPRNMVLWGLVDVTSLDKITQHLIKSSRSHTRCTLRDSLLSKIDPGHELLPIMDLAYDIHSAQSHQTFLVPHDSFARDLTLRKVVLEIVDNWGDSDYTCLFSLHIYGDFIAGV